MNLSIDKRYITLDEIIQASDVTISTQQAFLDYINKTHDFLMNQIREGKPIYGITTGYGASGKNYVTFEDSKTLQKTSLGFTVAVLGKTFHTKCVDMQ